MGLTRNMICINTILTCTNLWRDKHAVAIIDVLVFAMYTYKSIVLLGVYDFHIKGSHSTAAVSGEFWLSTDSHVINLVKMLDYSQKVSDTYLTTIHAMHGITNLGLHEVIMSDFFV